MEEDNNYDLTLYGHSNKEKKSKKVLVWNRNWKYSKKCSCRCKNWNGCVKQDHKYHFGKFTL